jgi:hypothetical protein
MIKAKGKKFAIPSDFGLSSSSFTFAFVGLLLLVVAYPKFDITKVLAQSTEENILMLLDELQTPLTPEM